MSIDAAVILDAVREATRPFAAAMSFPLDLVNVW